MLGKHGTDHIKWFLLQKAIREFRVPYVRAFANFGLFHLIQGLEKWTPCKFTQHRFLKPVALLVQVNKVCNLSCSFCFVNELNAKGAKEFDVTPAIFQRMLGHPLLNSLTRIGFTGGEPLLHPQLFDFIRQAKRTIPTVTVNTNLGLAGRTTQGKRRIDLLNQSGLDMLTVSLYHDNVKAIEEFAPQINNRMYKRLAFILSTGEDPFHHFTRMPEVVEMAIRLGFHGVYFQNFDTMEGVSEKKANLNKKDVSGFQPVTRDEQYLQLRDKVREQYAAKIAVTFPTVKRKLENPRKTFSCYQPDFQIGVDSRGNLAPCCNLDRLPEYGNLFTPDHWNNPTFQRIRAGIKKKDVEPTPYCANCTYLDSNAHDL